MISDKQINVISDMLESLGVALPSKEINEWMELYEQSKWVKFDPQDKSTWPNLPCLIFDKFNKTHLTKTEVGGGYLDGNGRGVLKENITHWQPLPEQPPSEA